MKTYSKNINLFLMDGTPSGRIKCTLANWTGIAYKIPRVDLELCKERADLKQSGVYLLFGESDDNQESVIYVGQADIRNNGEGILNRIQEHKKSSNKDYWSEAIVFTTSNNSFGPTEISYLENRFCNLASDSHRYEVKNEKNPTKGNITEEKESELEEFIDYAKIILGVLGHSLEPIIDTYKVNKCENAEENKVLFYIKRRGANAKAVQTSDGIVVLSNSILSKEPVGSCPDRALFLRKKYQNLIDENMQLKRSLQFRTPSGAACFVLLSSVNGNTTWKIDNGISLEAYESMY